VRVPARFRSSLEKLASLDEKQRRQLIDHLSATPTFASAQSLSRTVRAALPDLSESEASDLVLAFLSLITQLRYWNMDASELARQTAASPDLSLDDDERSELAALLSEALQLECLVTSAKAADVITEHEHVFSGVRVLTDIRPVFGDDVSEEPRGAVLLSTLKLDHFTDGEVRSLYVVMDAEDLETMREAIHRALDKTASLGRLVTDAGLSVFETVKGANGNT
jgi:hypothetical protein